MALVKLNSKPFGRNNAFPHALDALFDGLMHDMNSSTPEFRPHVDIAESDKSFTLELALPGMKKEDIQIDLDKNTIRVHGERQEKKEEKDTKYLRIESSYGQFERSFNLPDNIDTDQVEAQFIDGILHITLPKSENKASKSIRIK